MPRSTAYYLGMLPPPNGIVRADLNLARQRAKVLRSPRSMIPPQQANGVLPPFVGSDPINGASQSPYNASPEEFTARFATSPQRVAIAQGWLAHRAALYQLGFAGGFQWLAGSYCEVMSREPNDIDVVTFYPAAPGVNFQNLVANHPAVFHPRQAKLSFKCDAYFIGIANGCALVDLVRYWYSLFAHRRDGTWKGMLQIGLDPVADAAAAATLAGRP